MKTGTQLAESPSFTSTTNKPAYDVTGNIIAYEQGELSAPETLTLFSHLIQSGLAWQLQGSYGRMAAALIKSGLLEQSGELTEKGRNHVES